jgi:arylsulfatase B
LNNGKELYDIKADPGQKSDVASQHPKVVERLTGFYEKWWQELKPSFANSTAIYLGHPADNPARLTSHDWITTGSTPWNQSHVRRAMNGDGNTGFWNVKVFEPGEYEFRLRRWPEEIDLEIAAPLAAGAAVPGAKAYRTAQGVAIEPVKATLQIGDVTVSKAVRKGAKEVKFNLTVKAGKTTMSGLFESAEGGKHGAYFVYVTKK